MEPTDDRRRYLVTGADSGLGAEVAERLARHGTVITSGLGTEVDIRADLATPRGRDTLVEQAGALGRLDGVVTAAGIGSARPDAVSLNYFGTVAVLEGLRPALASSPAPAVTVVSSSSSLNRGSRSLVRACRRGDEQLGRTVARRLERLGLGSQIYRSSKIALNHWVRRTAVTAPWAGSGIVLNAVAPGVIGTDLVLRTWSADRDLLETALPQPLGAPGPVGPVADLIIHTVSAQNRFMTGQVIFCDGGTDALRRGIRPQQVFLRYHPREMIMMARAARAGGDSRRRSTSRT